MYRLPVELRPALARPFGPVHDSAGAIRATEGRLVVAVGDVVTRTFLDAGVVPKVMLIDGVTQRGTQVEDALQNLPTRVQRVSVENPPAHISGPLHSALEAALQAPGETLIQVVGVADLAALPAMILAPDGAAVCYGQPHEGVVVVMVTPEVRTRARDLLQKMDVV